MLKEIVGLNASSVERLPKIMNSTLMVELGALIWELARNAQQIIQK
jgi:hypothetical protein